MKKLFDSRGLGFEILDSHTLSEHDGGTGKTVYAAKDGKLYLEVFQLDDGLALYKLKKNELTTALAEVEALRSY